MKDLSVDTLLQFFEISRATLLVEAFLFLEWIEELTRDGRQVVALGPTAERSEQLVLGRPVANRASFAVECYVWALRHLARGETIAVSRWAPDFSACVARPLQMRGFKAPVIVKRMAKHLN